MEIYILKSAACLAILYSFYQLALEKEQMHTFKRFYLLGSLFAAFLIPFITFTTYLEASEGVTTVFISETIASETHVATNYLPVILWSIYVLGLLFFSFKFFRNLGNLILKIRRNPKVKTSRIINVLLKESTIPHTFFSFIFLNKEKYDAKAIPEAILIHERAHAVQKHSLDILLIEFLQVVFWFNPFIYLLKHSIKLNHEFLADEAVLKNGVPKSNYQNILVAFSSNAFSPQLANSINYSSIKKRITVMKTHSSKRSNLLRTFILLPLVALLVFGFSSREIVPKEESGNIPSMIQEKATPEQLAEYNMLAKKYNSQDNDNRFIKKSEVERLNYLYNLMSAKQRKNAEPFPKLPPPPKAPKTPKAPKAPKTPKASKLPKAPKTPKAPKPGKVVEGIHDTDSSIPPPPPPVVRLEPIDHIVRMAKENAAFFYEDKRISSDMAIALIKKNENLNIETTTFKASNPIVKITTKGVTIEK